MHRFFVPPDWIKDKQVTLVNGIAHQIKTVLRMKPGRKIIVLDNSGLEHYVNIRRIAQNVVIGEIYDSRPAEGEPSLKITLYQGTLKAQKFEWVLQKGTEVGISEFVPVICERSVFSEIEKVDEKLDRWKRIIQEAGEQSERGVIPVLRPAMIFGQACQRASQAGGLGLVAWESESEAGIKSILSTVPEAPKQVNLFVGPEGGLTLDEVRMASGYNQRPISLGKRILRAETAGMVAAAAILYAFDELGGAQISISHDLA